MDIICGKKQKTVWCGFICKPLSLSQHSGNFGEKINTQKNNCGNFIVISCAVFINYAAREFLYIINIFFNWDFLMIANAPIKLKLNDNIWFNSEKSQNLHW